MTTTLLPQPLETSARKQQARRVTAPAFRLLGLQPREARLEVIRRAIRKAAGDARQIPTAEAASDASEDRLVQITTAAYRLLDPRRRPSLFERVQLLLCNEEEFETASVSFWDESLSPGVTLAGRSSTARSATAEATATSQSASQSLDTAARGSDRDETQVALEVFRTLRHRDRRAKVLWISVMALAASLTLALATVTAWL